MRDFFRQEVTSCAIFEMLVQGSGQVMGPSFLRGQKEGVIVYPKTELELRNALAWTSFTMLPAFSEVKLTRLGQAVVEAQELLHSTSMLKKRRLEEVHPYETALSESMLQKFERAAKMDSIERHERKIADEKKQAMLASREYTDPVSHDEMPAKKRRTQSAVGLCEERENLLRKDLVQEEKQARKKTERQVVRLFRDPHSYDSNEELISKKKRVDYPFV